MAHKKAAGSTRLGRDSNPQYLGTKVADGEMIRPGMVIVRQRGTKIHPGKNVRRGKDDTIYAMLAGKVRFTKRKRTRFDGTLKMSTFVSVVPVTKA